MTWRCALLVILMGAGCASYQARPIDSNGTEAMFRERRLSDPALAAYIKENSGAAAQATMPVGWELNKLTLAAFYFHPDMDVARAKLAADEAGVKTAAARPNPTLSIDPEYQVNPESGINPWVLGFNLDVPIETAGKRGYRIQQARALAHSARLELGEAAWQVRSRLRGALLDFVLAGRELELARSEESARGQTVRLLARRLELGEVSVVEVDNARIDWNNAKLAIRAAAGQLAEARAVLALAIGVPLEALQDADIEWPGVDQAGIKQGIVPDDVRRAALLNRLDIRRALSDYSAAESALQLEVAKQYPDIHLGPGYTFDQGENKIAFGLSMEIPLFNQNQGPIAEAEAHRKQLAAAFMALQAQVMGQADQVAARYRSALEELGQADELVQLEHRHVKSVQRAFDIGEEDRLTLASAQVQSAVTERSRLDALRKAQLALGALEDVLQRPLDSRMAMPEISVVGPREQKRGDP